MIETLADRIDRRFDAWLDAAAERDVPAAEYGPGVRADYRDALKATTEAAVVRARISFGEAIAAPILKALVAVLDKTGIAR